jgi:cytoskeletal protein CcmA (bactofilin family)
MTVINARLWFKGKVQSSVQSSSILKEGNIMADKTQGISIIDNGLKVDGTVNDKEKLIIAGALEGTLIGNTVVTVQGSRVVADAKVRELIIAGDFEGDVTAYESLKILPTGNFGGNVVCKSLIMEAGAKLNGNVRPLEAKDDLPVPEVEAPAGKD